MEGLRYTVQCQWPLSLKLLWLSFESCENNLNWVAHEFIAHCCRESRYYLLKTSPMVVVHGTVAVVDVAVIDWHSGNSRPLLVLQTFFSFLSNFLRRKQIKGNNLPFICVKLVPSTNFLENRSKKTNFERLCM